MKTLSRIIFAGVQLVVFGLFVMLAKAFHLFGKNLRIGIIHSQSLGHFIEELDSLLEHDAGTLDMFIFQDTISNEVVERLCRENLVVVPRALFFLTYRIVHAIDYLSEMRAVIPEREITHRSKVTEPIRRYLDICRGENWHFRSDLFLKELRNSGKKLALLCIRDSGYDEKVRDAQSMEQNVGFRNESIYSYIGLIENLIRSDYVVVRMGRYCKETIEIKGFYDYCREFEVNDLSDFYFFFYAEFCISSGFGLEEIGVLLRKRTYLINVAPLGCLKGGFQYPCALPRVHIDSRTEKLLSISEIWERGMNQAYNVKTLERIKGRYLPNDPTTISEFSKTIIEMERHLSDYASATSIGIKEVCISKLWPNFVTLDEFPESLSFKFV